MDTVLEKFTFKDVLVDAVKTATLRLAEAEYPPEPEPEELPEKSPLAARIEKMLEDNSSAFGCNRPDVIRLVSAITGEAIDDPAEEKPVPTVELSRYPLAAVVPLDNTNSHNYEIGEPTVLVSGYYGVRGDRSLGNHLPTTKQDLRPATDEEIEAFFASLLNGSSETASPFELAKFLQTCYT